MARKYLDEINAIERPDEWCKNDIERNAKWLQQRSVYGFDERETWSLDITFYCWLYERVKFYYEKAPIDLDYHKILYKDKEITQRECLERILAGCEIALTKKATTATNESKLLVGEVPFLWGFVLPYMWW